MWLLAPFRYAVTVRGGLYQSKRPHHKLVTTTWVNHYKPDCHKKKKHLAAFFC